MKTIRQVLCTFTTVIMCVGLFGCNSSDSDKTDTTISTTEKTYNVDSLYDFRDMSIHISDEWTTEESNDTLTVTCKEDYSYMIIAASNANYISKASQIYDACASSESYQDISELKKFDYPLYTFDFTESTTGDPIEAYYFVKDGVCYFIAVPKKISGEDSIIYENINDVLMPVKVWISSCASIQDTVDTGFLFDWL